MASSKEYLTEHSLYFLLESSIIDSNLNAFSDEIAVQNMDAKFERRFLSFCNSLDGLAEARQRDLSDSFVLSGTSAKFSITFDLAWKVMRDILVQYYAITGFVAGSPREVLRESFKANLISDDTWMEMLNVRNELAHDYDGEIVKTHCHVIVETYIDLFYDFRKYVEKILHEI